MLSKYSKYPRLAALLIFFGIMMVSFIYIDVHRFLITPIIPVDKQVNYIVTPGKTIIMLADDLHKMGYLQRPGYLVWYAKLTGQARNIEAGEYLFKGGTTPGELLTQLTRGEVLQRFFMIIEGWTFKQIQLGLWNAPRLQQVVSSNTPSTIMRKLGSPYKSPEGLFFPANYPYLMGHTDFNILEAAYKKMQKMLASEWLLRDKKVPYKTPYEALIVASLIEKEAKLDEERPLIAGVIINRLKKSMRLQIDASVIYALGENYTGKLKHEDMFFASPYNTYRQKGLPPTPIATPGKASLHAALHPVMSKNFYYVAKGGGGHYFSVTYQEHNKAIDKYLVEKEPRYTPQPVPSVPTLVEVPKSSLIEKSVKILNAPLPKADVIKKDIKQTSLLPKNTLVKESPKKLNSPAKNNVVKKSAKKPEIKAKNNPVEKNKSSLPLKNNVTKKNSEADTKKHE